MKRLFTSTACLLLALTACSSETGGEGSATGQSINADSNPSSNSSSNAATAVASIPTFQLSPTSSILNSDDFFSNRDYRTTLESEEPIYVSFEGNVITAEGEGFTISGSTITITEEGTYVFSGSLSEGRIVVDMADDTHKAQLVLDNVTIENSTTAAIYIPVADKVFITMTEGSENTITSTIDDSVKEDSVDGAIFSRADLTWNGEGTLNLSVTNGDGIIGKDELTFTSGTYKINADGHGIDANEIIAIADGTFHIHAEKDGFHASHSSNEAKGNIYILGGDFFLDVGQDGFDASGFLEINDGFFDITTNGGWEAAPVKVAIANTGGRGTMGMGTTMNPASMNINYDDILEKFTESGVDFPEGFSLETTTPDEIREIMLGLDPEVEMKVQVILESMFSELLGGATAGMVGGQPMEPPEMLEGQLMEPPVMLDRQQGEPPEMVEGQQGEPFQMGDRQQGEPPEMVEGQPMDSPEMFGGQQGGNMSDRTDVSSLLTNILSPEETSTSTSAKGLKAVGSIRIYDGVFNLDCYDDAIHSDSRTEIHGGDFEIGTADDAIHATWDTEISGGNIKIISCFEGIEGQRILISGGEIDMYCGDDGINGATKSTDPNDNANYIAILGGNIVLDSNAEGDGIDSNGSIYMTGGSVLISSTEDTRDTSLDSQYNAYITGGSFLASGSNSATAQNFSSGSTQASIFVLLDKVVDGDVILTDEQGTVLVEYSPVKPYQSIHISTPDLAVGETYTLETAGQTKTITMDSLQYGESRSSGGKGQR